MNESETFAIAPPEFEVMQKNEILAIVPHKFERLPMKVSEIFANAPAKYEIIAHFPIMYEALAYSPTMYENLTTTIAPLHNEYARSYPGKESAAEVNGKEYEVKKPEKENSKPTRGYVMMQYTLATRRFFRTGMMAFSPLLHFFPLLDGGKGEDEDEDDDTIDDNNVNENVN